MPTSKNHKKKQSHKEWKKRQNKERFNTLRVEKKREGER